MNIADEFIVRLLVIESNDNDIFNTHFDALITDIYPA